jgi:hypothetical protein
MAAIDLTTLATVKAWLPGSTGGGIAYATDDALLGRLITAASSFVQSWLNRTVALAPYVEIRDGRGAARMSLANYPVVSVASVTIDGISIPAAPDSQGSGYTVSDEAVFLTDYSFTRGMRNVVVAYTAGYATPPPEIEQAVIELVALRYKERERIGLVSKGLAGETTAFSQRDMPADVATALGQYRRFAPI